MTICVVCGGQIRDAKRSTRHYCSNKCRSKADRSRRRVVKVAQSLTLSMWENIDLNEIKKVSIPAYNALQRIYATQGREFAEPALNAAMDIMMDGNLCSDDYWKLQDREGKRHET